jgi:hypothetical protein
MLNAMAVTHSITRFFIVSLIVMTASTVKANDGFSTKSGSVNVDCASKASTVATFTSPAGKTVATADAQWINLANVRSTEQHVVVAGQTVTASGSIWGFDKDWKGECKGGGHGELQILGTYK